MGGTWLNDFKRRQVEAYKRDPANWGKDDTFFESLVENGGRAGAAVLSGGTTEIVRDPKKAWMGPAAAGVVGAGGDIAPDMLEAIGVGGSGDDGGPISPISWTPNYDPGTTLPAGEGGIKESKPNTEAGLDMMKPGAAEQFYESTKDQYTGPSAAEEFWGQSADQFQDPTQGETFASKVDQRFGTGPQLNRDGGYGAYYDRAKERAVESLDSSLAARGAYGSSVGLGQIGETIADLEADRARTEADYNLRVSDTERAWLDSLSNIQSGAGRDRLDRLSRGTDAARTADVSRDNRLRTGADVAGQAQDSQRQRGRDYINDQMAIGDRLAGISADGTAGTLSNDQALLDAIISLMIGQGSAGVSNSTYWGAQGRDDMERNNDQIMNLYAMLSQNQDK